MRKPIQVKGQERTSRHRREEGWAYAAEGGLNT